MSEAMRPDLSHVMVERYPLMVAALLQDGYSTSSLPAPVLAELDQYVVQGLPVIATGQFARLPAGMPAEEAKRRMVQTIREVRA